MDTSEYFAVQFIGMKDGLHELEYDIDDKFFQEIEDSVIKQGQAKVKVLFDKRPNLFNLNFNFSGKISSICDRCLAGIALPISGDEDLVVRFSDEETDDADIIYLPMEATGMNLASYIYEFLALALPITKVYDCESEEKPPCDFDMLDRLDAVEDDVTENEENKQTNSVWDSLKGLDNLDNQ